MFNFFDNEWNHFCLFLFFVYVCLFDCNPMSGGFKINKLNWIELNWIELFPPFESTPLSPDWQYFWTPLSRAFRRLFLPWRPPKSRTLLNVPPIFHFIIPLLNFSGVHRERERKTTPFLKEISGWKVKYPPFLQYYSRAGLCRTKSTPLPEILGTRMRSLRPRSGGGGPGRCSSSHCVMAIFLWRSENCMDVALV